MIPCKWAGWCCGDGEICKHPERFFEKAPDCDACELWEPRAGEPPRPSREYDQWRNACRAVCESCRSWHVTRPDGMLLCRRMGILAHEWEFPFSEPCPRGAWPELVER